MIAERLFRFGCSEYLASFTLSWRYYFSVNRLVAAHFFAFLGCCRVVDVLVAEGSGHYGRSKWKAPSPSGIRSTVLTSPRAAITAPQKRAVQKGLDRQEVAKLEPTIKLAAGA
jgi:hypothetical protein